MKSYGYTRPIYLNDQMIEQGGMDQTKQAKNKVEKSTTIDPFCRKLQPHNNDASHENIM